MVTLVERRKEERSPVPMHVEVRLKSGVLVEGNARDVSLNGVYLETEWSLPLGCRVRVTMAQDMVHGEHVECAGEVTRLDAKGVAIAIDASESAVAGSIRHLLH